MKLVDFSFLFLSSSISVGKGKLIPSKKEKKGEEKKKRKSILKDDRTD